MNLLTRIWLKILKEWWQLYVPYRLRSMGVELGQDVRFYGMPIVGITNDSRIRIGSRVVLCSDSRFTALGVNHPVILRTLRAGAIIDIGDDTGVSGGSICAAKKIEIGKECLLGANVTLVDTDFHAIKSEGRRFNNNEAFIAAIPVAIGRNVFIGASSTVLKGVSVGDNSIIGAGSIVTKNVAANEIWSCKSAKFLREI